MKHFLPSDAILTDCFYFKHYHSPEMCRPAEKMRLLSNVIPLGMCLSVEKMRLPSIVIPLGMNRSVEKQSPPANLHSVGMHPIINQTIN